MRKAVMLAAGLFATTFLFSGCEESSKETWEFINLSNFTVAVSPDRDQTWESFNLEREQTQKISLKESTVHFRYTPSNRVFADTEQRGKIYFRNR